MEIQQYNNNMLKNLAIYQKNFTFNLLNIVNLE